MNSLHTGIHFAGLLSITGIIGLLKAFVQLTFAEPIMLD
jgi:hypothetical protein